MRFLFLFALLSSISFTTVHARADVSLLGDDGVALQIDGALDPTEAIADADRRSVSATALYVSSTVLLVTGAAGLVFGIPFIGLGGGLSSPGLAIAGVALVGLGGLTFIGHVITMVLAVCYDVGSGARRRAIEETTAPDLLLTGGPGDVGAGLALAF